MPSEVTTLARKNVRNLKNTLAYCTVLVFVTQKFYCTSLSLIKTYWIHTGKGNSNFMMKVWTRNLGPMLKNFFPSLLIMKPNKLECLYLVITFQSSLTFAGNTRSLPKRDVSERCSNMVGSGLALKF
jgi:hypothetical protein